MSNFLITSLIRLSSEKQKDKYAILTSLYEFLFGEDMVGDQDHYLKPLQKISRSKTKQAPLGAEQIRFLFIGGDQPEDVPPHPTSGWTIGLC